MIGKQQTSGFPHCLPDSVDTANELNSLYARFDVREFSEDCASLYESSSTFLRLMLSPASLDRTRTKPLTQLAERQDSEKLCGSAREDFHSNFSTILGLACLCLVLGRLPQQRFNF